MTEATYRRGFGMSNLSTPLEELPPFLATISMISDDEGEIVKGLTQAERKSPPRYEPTKQIFRRVLSGDLTYEFGIAQALKVADSIDRDCAVSVLRAAKSFLQTQSPARLEPLPVMTTTLPNGLEIKVGPIWVRHREEPRLLVLHFWQSALSPRQLSAASAILRLALLQNMPKYASLGIDFISVAVPEGSEARKFRAYDWKQLAPLDGPDLLKFSQQMASAWAAYKKIGPRTIKRRPRQSDLFG